MKLKSQFLNNTTTKPLNQNKMKNSAPIVEMTAVETLIHMLFVKKMFNEVNYTHTESEELKYVFDFANQIFRKQIIKAFNEGTFATDEKITAEQYYKKTFKLE